MKIFEVIEQRTYRFRDGDFKFFTAQFGSWANDKCIVFRVRIDNDPRNRAKEKGIRGYDRIFPAARNEINQWIKSKYPDYQEYTILPVS